MNKEAGRTQVSFHFSPASSYVLPLQSIRERIQGIWESLTWPVIKRIIKADLAATIAFALLMIEPIRRLTDYGIILAQIAVHFIHPAKSYGSLVEDIIFGTLMCIVAAGWSLLGTFCSSLVRNPDSTELAQPKVSGVLVIFLVIGAFCLNYLRARVDQANLGGMLSATILVISLTSAVLDKEWYPRTVLQTFVPVTVGFGIVFVIGIILWPENSTRICVEQLVKTLETFDGIARRQVEGFLHMGTFPRDESIYLSSGAAGPPPESLPVVHRLLDSSLSSLVEKKRIVRREISFNYIAPKDVSEMTKLLKKMRVPLQGISLSRAMEENMRKAHLQRHVARRLEEFAEKENLDPSANASNATLQSARRKNCTHRGKSCKEETAAAAAAAAGMSCISLSSTSSSCASPSSSSDDSSSTYEDDAPPPTVNPTLETPPPVEEGPGPRFNEKDADSDDEEEDHVKTDSPDTHITIALPPGDGFSAWRREYNEILKTVRPIYHSLLQACSSAVHDTIVRLQYLQRIDPQFQDKPHIYRMFAKKQPPTKFDKDFDPSIQLLKAIQEFDMYRLRGLERLYHPGEKPIPRRILFLLLHFQFNLRGYAERVYTLSSLVYEMVQARGEKRRLWMPHLSFRKFFGRRQVEADVGLDPPTTIVEAHNMESLQRTLSHRATHIMLNDELTAPQTQPSPSQPAQVNLLSLPKRGELRYHHRRHKRSMSLEQETAQLRGGSVDAAAEGGLDPLMYHDPDVAYPTTPFQRFCYNLWQFWARYVRTADTAFALRACAVVTVLTIPGFVEDSLDWYNRARGQWAAVVALVWMGPSVGSNFFGVMVRTVGTFIGAICSILVWEISRVNRIGLTILMFFFDLPWWVIYLNGKFWRAAGLFSLITTSIVIGYAYNYQMSGKDISMYEVLYERTVCVLIGVVVALIFSVFPLPRTGRVELRHRIARTLGDLAALYSSFLALLLKNAQRDPHVSMSNRKVFRMVAAAIRKQIKGQRVLLEQSRFEPALRGIFPEDKYVHILQVLENIVCLMIDMESALERIPERWRLELVQNTWKERKTAIASFLTALHMGANALSNKCPLPPYVLRPTRARRELTNKARQIRNLRPERLADPEYTYYSAYLMSSEQLAVEIESLVATIRDLVGPDSVSVWLEYKH